MKVQKCRNGHYFDTDTYQTCPLCGAQTEDVKPSMTDNVKIKKKSTVHIFTKKGKKTTGGEFAQAFDSNEPGHSYDSRQRNGIDKGTFDDRTAQQEQWNERGPSDGGMISAKTNSQAGSLNDKTQDIWQPTSFSGKSTNDIVDPVGEEPGTAGTNRIDALPMSGDIQRQKGTKPSLADEIKQVSSVADGKTMSFFSAYMDSGDSGARSAAVLDPVVGWFVYEVSIWARASAFSQA